MLSESYWLPQPWFSIASMTKNRYNDSFYFSQMRLEAYKTDRKLVTLISMLISIMIILSLAIGYFTIKNGAVHDISITYLGLDGNNNIIAIVRNQGNQVESFNATAYCNETAVDTESINKLQPNTDTTLTFHLDTSSLPHGMYNVSVVTTSVPNETKSVIIPTGALWPAANYFNFTNITWEGSTVSSGVVQITALHFDLMAVEGDAHNVTVSISGINAPINPFSIFNQTSQHLDIDFQIPYQATLGNNSAYPLTINVTGTEIDPYRDEVTLQIIPQSGSSYEIWRGGDRYYAKNELSGLIDYYGANFTHVFEQVLNELPDSGGVIQLDPGYYEGWIVINRSGITVQGQSVLADNPLVLPNGTGELPDDAPQKLLGTVLLVDTAGRDGIHFAGRLNGVHISNLGIQFTQNETGNGISDDMDEDYHLSYSSFENIMILNHDKDHYAIQMSNFLHLEIREIWAWGGPLLNLYGNMKGFQSGNSNFLNMYGYIGYDMGSINFTQGPYPIFVHKNDSLSSVWVNFLQFYRIQINCKFAQSDPNYYEVTLWDCRSSTITGLDLEGSGNGYERNKLMMGSCYSDEIIDAYMWSMANDAYVNVASNNVGNTFDTCNIAQGTILDSCSTDTWLSCSLEGTIDAHTKAQFLSLIGNYGSATLTSGSSEVNVTAKFIGGQYLAQANSLLNTSDVQVISVYSAPTNIFTVATRDGQPATQGIAFTWSVSPP